MTFFEILASRGGWMDCARTDLLWLEYRRSMGDKLQWYSAKLRSSRKWWVNNKFQICLIIFACSFPFKMKATLVRKMLKPGIFKLVRESLCVCRSRRYNIGCEKWWIPCAIALEPGGDALDSYSALWADMVVKSPLLLGISWYPFIIPYTRTIYIYIHTCVLCVCTCLYVYIIYNILW